MDLQTRTRTWQTGAEMKENPKRTRHKEKHSEETQTLSLFEADGQECGGGQCGRLSQSWPEYQLAFFLTRGPSWLSVKLAPHDSLSDSSMLNQEQRWCVPEMFERLVLHVAKKGCAAQHQLGRPERL